MIKSKFKYFGPFGAILILSVFLISFLVLSMFFPHWWTPKRDPIVFTLWSILILIFGLSYLIYRNFNQVSFTGQHVELRNLIFGVKKLYNNSDFDGYIIKEESSRIQDYQVIYLVLEGENFIKISSAYYKNFVGLHVFISNHFKILEDSRL